MSLSRTTLVALLLAVALAAFAMAWVHMDLNRDGDMRSSEDAFYDRLKSGKDTAHNPFAFGPAKPARREPRPASDPALDAWYAESNQPAEQPAEASQSAEAETAEAPPA